MSRSTPPQVADVCLVLEGCYPFVTGGVSQWVQMLMENLPELTFSVAVVSADETPREPKYTFPPNVVEVVETYIERPSFSSRPAPRPAAPVWQALRTFHETLAAGSAAGLDAFLGLVHGRGAPRLDVRRMLTDPASFDVLRSLNESLDRTSPLIDYFHTWRSTHFPLFHLLWAPVPRARVYHAISTGYAGFLGAVASWRHGAPYLLTEHGIYTKEREMEIMRADWIDEGQKPFWIRYFNGLGRVTYEAADVIISLFDVNRRLQVSLGADERRTRVIFNGIQVERFASAARPADDGCFRVGLVGRVTPIKDIKTFVKACALVSRRHPRARFHVLGPWEEDPQYARECMSLARDLGIDRILTFEGKVNVLEWYPRLDLLVLSSVKEAQPLVLIEGMVAGVPSVATKVGGVAEVIEDCGLVVHPKRPTEMARAMERFIDEPEFHARCVAVGLERARKLFSLDAVVDAYRRLYRDALDGRLPAREA